MQTDTQREEQHVKMEAKIGVMQLQAKEHQKLLVNPPDTGNMQGSVSL